MRKFIYGGTEWKYHQIRRRYQEKRHKLKWKNRKKEKRILYKKYIASVRVHRDADFVELPAPLNFSFVSNPDKVLEYFDDAKNAFKSGKNVRFDISEVDALTPDAIALLVAHIKNKGFVQGGIVKGNAPNKPELKTLFLESGFGDHMKHANGFKTKSSGNLLHKEVEKLVVPEIARDACIFGLEHVMGNSLPFPPLYEILIECMSNTHNHASLFDQGKCQWWLYVYNDPKLKRTSYTFIDLGVGIFSSAHTKDYIRRVLKLTSLYPNIKLVDDLLEGKIHSRIKFDQGLRGKGLPQIVRHSKLKAFKSFVLISNDVKVDLKTGEREQLKHSFNGTFWYWELVNE